MTKLLFTGFCSRCYLKAARLDPGFHTAGILPAPFSEERQPAALARARARICSEMIQRFLRYKFWFTLAAGIVLVATGDLSAALIRGGLAHAREQREQQAQQNQQTEPTQQTKSKQKSPQPPPQDNDHREPLRHRPNLSNPYDVQFRDVTSEAGIHFHHERAHPKSGCIPKRWAQVWPGLITTRTATWTRSSSIAASRRFFIPRSRRSPRSTATIATARSPTSLPKARSTRDGTFFFGVAVGDFDNDGFPDIYMTGYRHSVLLHNNGDGTFTDVTEKAGVADDGNWGTAAGWFDYDRDGKLDLLVVQLRAVRRGPSCHVRRFSPRLTKISACELLLPPGQFSRHFPDASITTMATARSPTSPKKPGS